MTGVIKVAVPGGGARARVHLVTDDRPHWRAESTLCGSVDRVARSTQSFLRLGCPDCALRAVELGAVAVNDAHAVVSLPRFVARRAVRPRRAAAG